MTVTLLRGDGAAVSGERWIGPVAFGDAQALSYATSPVLDVGCGPGRHTIELAARGVVALGIDITPRALVLARARGASVLERCVFDPLPGTGRWGTVLLLDGNIAIGGDPHRLLRRLRQLLRPDGVVIIEFTHVGDRSTAGENRARLLCDGHAGPWFEWQPVPADAAAGLASDTGFAIEAQWTEAGRSFAVMSRR